MFKKLLATLSSLSAIILTTASVVSCGPSMDRYMNRKVDNETYYGIIASQVSTWSSAKTQDSGDTTYIANLVDGILRNDNYNNIVGDVADGWKATEDYKQWQIHINPEAEWFDYQGNPIVDKAGNHRYIKAHDVANTLRYTLNPGSLSPNGELWTNLLVGGPELTAKISETEKKFEEEAKKHPEWSSAEIKTHQTQKFLEIDYLISLYIKGDISTKNWTTKMVQDRLDYIAANPDGPYMLEINDQEGLVNYNMSGPSQFFDSALTYNVYAPIPDEAIDWLGTTSLNARSYGRTYKDILTSGNYYVSNSNSVNLTLRKNENHHKAKDVFVKKLVYNFSRDSSPSTLRMQWQNGDVSEFAPNTNDTKGWREYVGNDFNDPKFAGAHIWNTPARFSQYLAFNFGATKFDRNPGSSKDSDWVTMDPEKNPVNQAIAQRSVRTLISYALNRQLWISYYTKNIEPADTKVYLKTINRFVPKGLNDFSNLEDDNGNKGYKDENYSEGGVSGVSERALNYTDLVDDHYLINIADPASKGLEVTLDGEAEKKKLGYSQDLYFNNDYIAYNNLTSNALKTEFKAAKNPDEKIQVLIKQVNEDFKTQKIDFNSRKPAWFNLITPKSWSQQQFSVVYGMTRNFNAIKNLPVKIDVQRTQDNDAFLKIRANRSYNLLFTGWGPDYLDPSNFLNILTYDGSMSSYYGYQRVIDANPGINEISYKGKDPRFDDLAKEIGEYTTKIKAANNLNNFERFNEFAKQEAAALYQNIFILPMTVDDLDQKPVVSYVNPFTKPTSIAGSSDVKFIGRQMLSKLWTKKEFEEAKAKFEEGRDDAIKAAKEGNKLINP